MHQYCSDDGCHHIENGVQSQGIETSVHHIAEEPHGHYQQSHATHQWVQHLLSGIKLQMFLVSRANTGDAHQQERHHLAIHKVAVMVDEPLLDAVVQVAHHTAKTVYRSWVYGILKELHQHGYVDDRPEYLVKSL